MVSQLVTGRAQITLAAKSKTQALRREKKVSRQSLPLSRAPLTQENISFAANKVQGASGGLCETCFKRHELKAGATNGRSDWLHSSQGMREAGSKTQLMSSSSGSAESCCYLGSLLGMCLPAFFPLGHHLSWLSGLCFHCRCQLNPGLLGSLQV